MSQQSFHQQTATGADINFTITTFSSDEIKVYVDGVLKSAGSDYNINPYNANGQSTVDWIGTAPSSPSVVRVVRQTDVMNNGNTAVEGRATFQAGSSVKADDLNNNTKQALRALKEQQDQKVQSYDFEPQAVNTAALKDSNITEAKIANSAVTQNKLANNSVGTPEIINGSVTTDKIANDSVTMSKLGSGALPTDITIASANLVNGTINAIDLAGDSVDGSKIADNSIDSEHYVDGSIDNVHIANSAVTSNKIANGTIESTDLAANSITTNKIVNDAVTIEKIADSAIVTASEQGGHTINDTTFFTTAAAEARYFNASTGETIKNGDTFPDNDTTIATTAAINDRIIDLVDDVGGFVPIANETSFPTANPDVNNGSGTLVSIKSISSTRTPSSGTVTIANGAGTGNTVTITGCGSTVLTAGFGVIVETTTTLHTYAFHRLVPKATEVTTVAGISSNVTTVATNIADINTVAADLNEATSEIDTVATNIANVNTVGNAIANVNTTAGSIANVNTTAGSITNVNNVGNNISNVNAVHNNASNINSAVSNASNINSAVSNASNINTVAGSISNVNTVSTNISSVNNVSSNISDVNNFADLYQIHSNNPTTDGGGNALAAGDLYFNTNANSLKVYTGNAWVDGVTATGNFAVVTGNTFTGDNRYNDGVKAFFGTGSDFSINHNGSFTLLDNTVGNLILRNQTFGGQIKLQANVGEEGLIVKRDGSVDLYYDGSKKFETTSSGATVTGNLFTTNKFRGNDNVKLDLGTGNDLQIYHDGTDNVINNSGTTLAIFRGTTQAGNSVLEVRSNHGATGQVKFKVDGNGDVLIPTDSSKLQLGVGQDLQIYHTGSHSHIQNYTGEFRILGNQIRLKNKDNDETYLSANDNGAVELYYNNTKKLETTDNGADLFNRFRILGGTAPSLQINRDSTGNNTATRMMLGLATGANNFINGSTTDDIVLNTPHRFIVGHSTNEIMAIFDPDGEVQLRHDNSTKFQTTSEGVSITGHVAIADNNQIRFGDSNDLVIQHNTNENYIQSNSGHIYIRANVDDDEGDNIYIQPKSGENSAVFTHDGAVELYYDNGKKLETTIIGITTTGRINQQVNSSTVLPTSYGVYAYQAYDHELVIDNNTAGNEGSFAGIYFNAGADTDGSKVGTARISAVETGNFKADLVFGTRNTDFSEKLRIRADGDIRLPNDNQKLQFGAAQDMEINHDGSNSFVTSSTGQLYLTSSNNSNVWLRCNEGGILTSDGSEYMIRATSNGSVKLFHDNSKKFETSSGGVKVVGDLVLDDATKSIQVGDVTNDNFTGIKHEIAANAGDAIRGFVAQNNNASLVENLQGSTNQFLVLGDTDDLSADTLFGVSVVRSGTTRARLTLSGTGNLTVPGRVTCDDLSFIPSGTKMLFQQTAAPSGWTKVTSGVNNSALRVVHGTAGTGGSNGFTNVFNSDVTTSGGSVASHTLTTSQIPSHNHSIQIRTGRDDDNFSFNQGFSSDANTSGGTFNSNSTGGGQGHSHNFNHPSFNLNVAYTDVIICTKD